MSTFGDALRMYLLHHSGPHWPAKETPIESPLQWVLELAYQQQKQNNALCVREAAQE